jgi:hypothetical protein
MLNFSRSTLPFALCGTLALLATANVQAAPDPAVAVRFEHVVHDFYERYLATHPEEATQLGDHRFDRRSGDSSAATPAARCITRRWTRCRRLPPRTCRPTTPSIARSSRTTCMPACTTSRC